ncbi:response regulator [Paenibacillus sp. PL2-23]|uniref:response regulator transcription factor n=1 Tax=Paenibacillus sp. PL2-23 TaxID=2100729 RepID=UPI0030FAFC92
MAWTVLLVDDEWLVRRELAHLVDWGALGFSIIGEASNGTSAINMIEQHSPDVVILDIQMPGMDGVELAMHIFSNNLETKMLVLSSYDHFEYVKSTLKSGAVDYILKHELNAHLLKTTLVSISKQLEDRERKLNRERQYDLDQRSNQPALLRHYVREILLGGTTEWKPWMKSYSYSYQRSALLVLQIAYFFNLTHGKSDTERSQIVTSIIEVCQQAVGTLEKGCVVHIDHGRFAVLIGYPNLSSESAIYQDLQNLEGQILRTLHLILNMHVAVQIAGVCTNTQLLHEMYGRAAAKLRFLSGLEPSISRESIDGVVEKRQLFSIEQEKRLLSAVIGGEEEVVVAIIEELYAAVISTKADELQIQLMVNELITLARKVLVKSGIKTTEAIEHAMMQLTTGAESLGDLIKALFIKLVHSLEEDKMPIYSPYIIQVVDYIQKHYRKEISLDSTARYFNLSPSYLSRLFKSETGTGFIEYVNRIRVKAGRELLESGELTVKEVYEQVGFNNYSYFFRVFKDITGLTPQQAVRKRQHMD